MSLIYTVPKGTAHFECLNVLLYCLFVCVCFCLLCSLNQKMLSVISFFILMFRLVNTHTLLLPFWLRFCVIVICKRFDDRLNFLLCVQTKYFKLAHPAEKFGSEWNVHKDLLLFVFSSFYSTFYYHCTLSIVVVPVQMFAEKVLFDIFLWFIATYIFRSFEWWTFLDAFKWTCACHVAGRGKKRRFIIFYGINNVNKHCHCYNSTELEFGWACSLL